MNTERKHLCSSGRGGAGFGSDSCSYFGRHGSGAAEAVMCGSSLRSVILPALEAGAWGAYVPYHITWAHELAEPPEAHDRFTELASIAELPEWVRGL